METSNPIQFDDPQVLGQGEESPSLRQQKRPETRKHRPRWRLLRHPRKVLFGLVVLGAIAYAAWAVVHFLRNDPHFFLAAIHVQGGKYVAQSMVQEKFSLDRGQSVFRIPLGERRAEIEQIPWVRAAALARVLPNQLVVFLEERVPVAFAWTDEGVFLVDAEGVLLDYPPQTHFTLPVVRGLSDQEPAEERRAKMQLFMALQKDLNRGGDAWSEAISEVDVSDLRDARVVVADSAGAILLHLGRERFRDRYETYENHIGQWKQKFANIQSIDLRYDGQVVLNADSPTSLTSHSALRQSSP
ncbi:MAG: FtsQ-type POTRA domain-containing protein [Acidobacteria bacterium]|nr:FtsQ-type POTRA domain-containing protein [Acidobacteriota bacterium]